ncbi:hypothetical protein N7492_001533 [Penicillium capsulatum]|uniref:C2H2-type domain-containing protein n=1 Tax=Penicillium capsulatum TaxID=69766 RepID=A0A9W9ITU5_9EURO|nr:hypothetical protein N7492_001533 [Penicillium capsulatum]KAJ6129414.1 hypothetical protein N7512_002194 [Penicillium capsulatum]
MMPMTAVSAPTYEAYDASLPADHPFVTRASQFQFHLSPLEHLKAREPSLPPQAWWKGDDSSFSMGYLPPDYPAYGDRFSPWNSGLSTISDPQSPRSSNSGSVPAMNCITSPPYRHEEMPVTTAVDGPSGYPAPDSLVDMPKPRLFEVQPDQRSPFEQEMNPWAGSQSDRNVTPDTPWSSSLSDAMAFPTSARRTKTRDSTSRIRKSTAERRPTSAPARNRRRRGATNAGAEAGSPRTFVCSFAPYGCESTFVSKNEWKRHVTSQHLQLGFYRCDVGKCSVHTQASHTHSHNHNHSHFSPSSPSSGPSPGQPNDFNRKDLFTQHQRRMHAPWLQSGRRRTPTDAEHASFEASLEEVRRRCWYGLRQPPQQSHCGFCQEIFSGEGSWDARMEHVGRHFEREDRHVLGDEVEDVALREWGLREGILTLAHGKCRLASLVGGEV